MGQRSETDHHRRRIMWLGLLLVTWMIAIIWRLAWVQVVRHEEYAQNAQRAQQKEQSLLPPRGTILDRHGKKLAYSVIVESVFADLGLFRETTGRDRTLEQKRQEAVQALAPLLGYTEQDLTARLSGDARFLWLKRRLDPDTAAAVKKAIAEHRLAGIQMREEAERSYPNGQLAGHLLGYVGADQQGKAGIEKRFDLYLQGRPGEVTMTTTAGGRPIERFDLPATSGATVQLTIDASLQRKAELLLEDAVRLNKAKGGSLVVMDPRTGEILAMVSAPGFDPNRIEPNVEKNPAYVNQAVMSPYEPGSIFKIITYAAGFEQGIVKPDDLINCGNGQIAIGKRIIRDTHAYGTITVEDAFAKSSNVGAIKIAQRLGKEAFHQFIKRFGFGDPTRIELPGESRGIVHPTERWRPDSIGSVAIGQEISVTLVQAVSAIAAIANQGVLVQPHLVEKVTTPDGNGILYQPEIKQSRVISEQTAQMMTRILERVVTAGTGRHAVQLDGYTAAGKTGTPQKPAGKSGYGAGKYMPSFLGFVPATSPRFAIVVMIDEPAGGSYYGGIVAAPIFTRLAEAALGDNDIGPDDVKYRQSMQGLAQKIASGGPEITVADGDEETTGLPEAVVAEVAPEPARPEPARPDVRKKKEEGEARVSANIPGAMPEMTGKPAGPQPSQRPQARPQATPANRSAAVRPDDGQFQIMPDLRGRGPRTVAQACAELQLNVKLHGTGVAVSQSPAAGARIRPGEDCRVTFK